MLFFAVVVLHRDDDFSGAFEGIAAAIPANLFVVGGRAIIIDLDAFFGVGYGVDAVAAKFRAEFGVALGDGG